MKLEEYKKLNLKKNKFGAQKVKIDGIIFDSKAESDLYILLKSLRKTDHIDVHVPVSLPGGVRFKVDFIVWNSDGTAEAFEYKGKETSDFRTKLKLFDNYHPLKPLKVINKISMKGTCV